MGPGSLVELPENGEIGYTATNATIQQILDTLDYLIKQAAVNCALPASALPTKCFVHQADR